MAGGAERRGPHPHVSRARRRAARLRSAYASCQHWEHGYFGAYRHMRAENPDLVLFLGDYIYEYRCEERRAHADRRLGAARSTTTATATRYTRATPTAGHARGLPVARDLGRSRSAERLRRHRRGPAAARRSPDFAARRAAAYQAYYEHMPLRASGSAGRWTALGAGAEMRIYASEPFGPLATSRAGRPPVPRSAGLQRGGRAGPGTVDPADVRRVDRPRAHVARRRAGAMARRVFAHGAGLERDRAADAVWRSATSGGPGPVALERRLGRLPCRAHALTRRCATRGHQRRVPRRRRARELGGPCQVRLRQAGQSRRWAWILRHQHHFAFGRQCERQPNTLAEKPPLRLRRCASVGAMAWPSSLRND